MNCGDVSCAGWDEQAHDECETVVAHEHGLPGVGLSVPVTTVPSYDALLSGVSTQAIFDALAAKSRAELSAALPALKRIGDRIGKRLVPIWRNAEVPQGCQRCHSMRAHCDGRRPCGRCLSRNLGAQCVYPSDPDFVPPSKARPRGKRTLEEAIAPEVQGGMVEGEGGPGRASTVGFGADQHPPPAHAAHALGALGGAELARLSEHAEGGDAGSLHPSRGSLAEQRPPLPPAVQRLDGPEPGPQHQPPRESAGKMQRRGRTASGDVICPHGVERRHCVDPHCVATGGGKAMCQHGRRRRTCKEPECRQETERRRQEAHARGGVDGRFRRLRGDGEGGKQAAAAVPPPRQAPTPPPPPGQSTAPQTRRARQVCQYPECRQAAQYGHRADMRRVACATHKQDCMLNLTKALCYVETCPRAARFGAVGQRPVACVLHRREEFVDRATKRCQHREPALTGDGAAAPACTAGANYGDACEGKRRFCRKHKRASDVLLARRRRTDDAAVRRTARAAALSASGMLTSESGQHGGASYDAAPGPGAPLASLGMHTAAEAATAQPHGFGPAAALPMPGAVDDLVAHGDAVIDDGAVQEHQDTQEHHDKSIGGAVAHANERPPAPPHQPPPPSD